MSWRIGIILALVVLLGSVGCRSAPTTAPVATPTVANSPTVPPTPVVPTLTATITPTRLPLSLFPGFVDAGCAWGIPLNQLLDCLSKFTGSSLRSADGSYVASRDTLQAADGRPYEINVLNQSGRILRNVQGTTYWDLSVLTPTPTATLKPVSSATAAPVPQAAVGSLRFYGFEGNEIQFITEMLTWVNQVGPELYRSTTNVDVSIYKVEPDFLSSVAAVSGLSYAGAHRSGDMLTLFAADRINVRSDYIRAALAGTKGSTPEANQASLFALLARQIQHVRDYRAYRPGGRPFSSCDQITPQQEQAFEAAGFRAQLEAIERIAGNALGKGLVAPQEKPAEREKRVKLFKSETDQWIADLRLAVQSPQNYSAFCYPPTPTPIPSPTPIPPTPTLAPGTGALVVVNPWGESTITINGPTYQIPTNGEISIPLPAGRYAYTVNVLGRYASTGLVEIQAGQSTRLHVPSPPPPEPASTRIP